MTLWCEPVASLTQHLVTRFDVMMHVQPLSFKKQLICAYPNIAWNRRQRVLTENPLITASYGGEQKEREGFWGLPVPQTGFPRPRQGSFAPLHPRVMSGCQVLTQWNWYLSLHCPTNAIVDVDSLQRSGKIIVIQGRNVLRRTMLWYNGNIATC